MKRGMGRKDGEEEGAREEEGDREVMYFKGQESKTRKGG